MELKDRFLKYVSFDTQSDESSETFPSTAKQRVLLDYLAEEMKTLGLTEVTVDKYGYAMGTIPATPGCEKAPVIGFIAHVDTEPEKLCRQAPDRHGRHDAAGRRRQGGRGGDHDRCRVYALAPGDPTR